VRGIVNAKQDYSPMFSCGSDASWLDYAAGAVQRSRVLYCLAAEVAAKLAK